MQVHPASGQLEAWVPSGLLQLQPEWSLPRVTREGLVPVRLSWRDGHLLELIPVDSAPSELALPRLVDPHVHLDKALSWRDYPNLSGTYAGAMAANLQEHGSRTQDMVLERGEWALQQAFQQGYRALRSHIDSGGPASAPSWDALIELRERWLGRITLQLVALVPLAFWSSPEAEQLASRVAKVGGLLGGVLAPPCGGAETRRLLKTMLRLADRLGCPIDLHIDEADHAPGQGVRQLLDVLERNPVAVPITCSHASSLSLLGRSALRRLGERMAAARLQVIALPLTNGWLLGRETDATPVRRLLAPIRQLQRCGVQVAVGGDNVGDPWFPGGSFDPLQLLASSLPITQLLPWQRLGLSPHTTAAASLLQLNWDGTLTAGAPADLILASATTWSELLRCPPKRRILVNGSWMSPCCD